MVTKLNTVRLECDDCGCVRQGKLRQSIGTLRLQLRRVGWTSTPALDRDICQACTVTDAAPADGRLGVVR